MEFFIQIVFGHESLDIGAFSCYSHEHFTLISFAQHSHTHNARIHSIISRRIAFAAHFHQVYRISKSENIK